MSATKKVKNKPVPGHKRASVSFGVCVTCECGWQSSTWYGPDASKNAHAEWRMHTEKHTESK